jgi:membrane-associated phospholipid phosphatase
MKVTKWERFVLYPLAAILLVVFAFYDLPIMQALFNPSNVFGRLGELGGEIPTQLLGVVAGFWLFRFRDKSTPKRSILFGILFALVALFFAGYGGGQIYSYLKEGSNTYTWHPGIWFAVPLAAVYVLVGGLIAFKVKVTSPKDAVVFAYFFLILYAATWLLMNVGKFLWYRPRYRYLYFNPDTANDPGAYFVPWYRPQCSGRFSDNFASFPSGHVMNSLAWISLCLTGSFLEAFKNKGWIIRLSAYLWAFLVAISRTIMGAHFPSDTTAGFLLEFLLFDLLSQFFYPWFRRKLVPDVPKSENPPESPSEPLKGQ